MPPDDDDDTVPPVPDPTIPDDEDDATLVPPGNPLPQDGDTPFSPAGDVNDDIPVDHPATDTGIQPEEAYDEGLAEAAEADNSIAH